MNICLLIFSRLQRMLPVVAFLFVCASSRAQTLSPEYAGSIGGSLLSDPNHVTVSGNYAYVASYGSHALEILDISNPSAPVHKGSIAHGAGGALLLNPNAVAVSGNYAYVTSGGSDAVEIIDISNPSSPIHKGSITHGAGGALLDNPSGVTISGNFAYVASANSNALEIIDISNPSAPAHKGSITHGTGGALLFYPVSVTISGAYAYVASYASDALEIIDISNPSMPVHKGSINDGAGGASLNAPMDVVVSGNFAYVVSYDSDALEIIDITNPAWPLHKGKLLHGTGGALLDRPYSVTKSGNLVYVASGASNALEIIDVSNPAAPFHKSNLTHETGGAFLFFPKCVTVSNDLAYIVGGSSNQGYALEVVDISNPLVPVHKGSVANGSTSDGALLANPKFVTVSGNHAYVASASSNALEIVDISNPSSPAHKGKITDGQGGALLKSPTSVAISGNYAYATSAGSHALEVIDISNPAAPVHAGSIMDNFSNGIYIYAPSSVAVSGNYAYITSKGSTNQYHALEIVDISNPTAPVHTGKIIDGSGGAALQYPNAVAVSGNYAYVVTNGGYLEIVDISNPAAPFHKGKIYMGFDGATLNGIVVSGNHAYITSSTSHSLKIIDISNPSLPVLNGTIVDGQGGASLRSPKGIAFWGNYVFVTSLAGGIEIMDVSNPTTPVHAGYFANGSGTSLLTSPSSLSISGRYVYATSESSNALIAIEFINVPLTPTATAANLITSASFVANWNVVSSATNYFIDVATDAGFHSILSNYNGLSVNSNSASITGLQPNTPYFYRVRANNSIGTSASSNVISIITAKSDQTITFIAPGDKTLGESPFMLQGAASSNLPVSYVTTSNNIAIAGSEITMLNAGRVNIQGQQNGNEQYNAATPVDISFCVNPAQPVISLVASLKISSSSPVGNQWYKNGIPIPGATGQTLTITKKDSYHVVITIAGCASLPSATYSGSSSVQGDQVIYQVYPNPVGDRLTVDISATPTATITLYNQRGEPMNAHQSETKPGLIGIEMTGVRPGKYVLAIRNGANIETIHIVK